MIRTRLLSLLLLAGATSASATTWFPADIDDPFAPGEKCDGQQPASWGSYIYHWESKYDQVFWPHVEAAGVWSCPHSGFVAFLGDFELAPAESDRIRAYLATLPDRKPASRAQQLERLEAIYALRDKDAEYRRWLVRVLAFAWEDEGDAVRAAALRAQAAGALRAALGEDLKPALRAEYLFVLAAYAREAGDAAQSDADLAALASVLDAMKGDDADFAAYLRELARSVPRIAPGGKLAPPEGDDRTAANPGSWEPLQRRCSSARGEQKASPWRLPRTTPLAVGAATAAMLFGSG